MLWPLMRAVSSADSPARRAISLKQRVRIIKQSVGGWNQLGEQFEHMRSLSQRRRGECARDTAAAAVPSRATA